MLTLFLLLCGCDERSILLAPSRAPEFIYLLDVASFQDSDGDGVGDIEGVRWHIQHIRSLGVRTVQLLPIEPGWNTDGLIPDGLGIDPALGGDADLAALADDLHANGMTLEVQVPMDAVGLDHPWFRAALRGQGRIRLALEQRDHWYPTGDRRYYYASAGAGRPDLDWGDPGLPGDRADTLFPLLEAGVDGVVLRAFEAEGRSDTQPVAEALIAEIGVRQPAVAAATTPAESSVDSLRPWTSLGPVADLPRALAWEATASEGDFDPVAEVLDEWGDDVDATRPFLGDGDRSRLASRVPDATVRQTLMVMHLLGAGHPSLYYGEELDLADATTTPVDAPWRAPMAWDSTHNCGFTTGEPWYKPDPACKVGWNAYDEARDPQSMLALVRWLGRVRAAHGASTTTRLDTGYADVMAFLAGELLVVGSLASGDRAVVIPGLDGVDLIDGSPVGERVTLRGIGWRVVRVAE